METHRRHCPACFAPLGLFESRCPDCGYDGKPDAVQRIPLGMRLQGRYRVGRALNGAYLGFDSETGERVRLEPYYGNDRTAFFRRADALLRVSDCVGLIAVTDAFDDAGAAFTGVELREELTALSKESAALNGQEIPFYTMDVADAPAFFGHGSFSAAVCNPPYYSAGEQSPNDARRQARHADADALDRFFHAAFLLLKNGGALYVCFPADRITTLFRALYGARLMPKRLRPVAAAAESRPYLLLVQAKKDAKEGLIFEPTQILSNG